MMMPVMDGAGLAAAMRSDRQHRDMPIIMMTSLPTARPHPDGLFDAVLRKPFTPELLLETLGRCLANAGRSAPEWNPLKNEADNGNPETASKGDPVPARLPLTWFARVDISRRWSEP